MKLSSVVSVKGTVTVWPYVGVKKLGGPATPNPETHALALMPARRFPLPWSVEEQGASNRQMWPRLHQQDKVGGPKTLGNATPVDVVVPPVVGGPEQGWPVNGFVPVDRLGMLGAGETGVSRPAATVFPLRIGLTVFPLRSGLLVFCASNTVVVALRTRTLRPISAMRFTAMSDLLVVAPDTNRNTSDFLDCPEDKRRRLKLLTKEEARRIAANIAKLPKLLREA